MINAVLVFNGQGQPRLTKFYTQLVSHSSTKAAWLGSDLILTSAGNKHSTAPDLRNIYLGVESPKRRLQLLASAASFSCFGHLHIIFRAAQRCSIPRHIPQLRDSLLYHHIDIDRVPVGPAGPNTSLCGVIGQAL